MQKRSRSDCIEFDAHILKSKSVLYYNYVPADGGTPIHLEKGVPLFENELVEHLKHLPGLSEEKDFVVLLLPQLQK